MEARCAKPPNGELSRRLFNLNLRDGRPTFNAMRYLLNSPFKRPASLTLVRLITGHLYLTLQNISSHLQGENIFLNAGIYYQHDCSVFLDLRYTGDGTEVCIAMKYDRYTIQRT